MIMTRDVIAKLISDELKTQADESGDVASAGNYGEPERFDAVCLDGDFDLLKVADRFLCAPDSTRQELAALLNPWRPIANIPTNLKDGRPVLTLIPCYGYYNKIGQLRGYLHAIVEWKYGQWNEVGMGKREPAYFQELLSAPPSEDKA